MVWSYLNNIPILKIFYPCKLSLKVQPCRWGGNRRLKISQHTFIGIWLMSEMSFSKSSLPLITTRLKIPGIDFLPCFQSCLVFCSLIHKQLYIYFIPAQPPFILGYDNWLSLLTRISKSKLCKTKQSKSSTKWKAALSTYCNGFYGNGVYEQCNIELILLIFASNVLV